MPLPEDPKTKWPPSDQAGIMHDISIADAWYAGDKAIQAQTTAAAGSDGIFSALSTRLFRKEPQAAKSSKLDIHVPIAADIASTASDFLFGEDPGIEAPEDADPESVARLEKLFSQIGFTRVMLEGAEIASALGGIYLRPIWNTSLADHPFLDVVHPDLAIPEFAYGQLQAVTFFREFKGDASKGVYRHLERYEPGVITHGLYLGDKDTLGQRVPLEARKETAGMEEVVDVSFIPHLMVHYVANKRPNRKRRNTPFGQPDTAGAEDLMAALNKTFSSWMRDIRLGQARLHIANDLLRRVGRGEGAEFDVDKELYTTLNMTPQDREKTGAISETQFAIRVDEHSRTAQELARKIFSGSGYSPQSFGMDVEGQAESGTALKLREGKSYRTTAKKWRYYQPACEAALETLLAIDREIFGRPTVPFRPTLKPGSDSALTAMETAQTVSMYNAAQAMSTLMRVKMAQPHLTDDQAAEEAERIMAEQGLSVSDPTGGLA